MKLHFTFNCYYNIYIYIYFSDTSKRVFLLAAVSNNSLQSKIVAESEKYGDIIQADFIDSYHNLSFKGLSQLQWVKNFCNNTRYLVKTDDDLYIDIFQMRKVLKSLRPGARFIVGKLILLAPIMRSVSGKGKWDVKKHLMPGSKYYPPYIGGWIYILSSTVISEIYNIAMATPVFHIDDVYITGLLAGQLSNFTYLNFVGKAPKESFRPTHLHMARQCRRECKVTLWCKHLNKLSNIDKEMLDADRLKDLVIKCRAMEMMYAFCKTNEY